MNLRKINFVYFLLPLCIFALILCLFGCGQVVKHRTNNVLSYIKCNLILLYFYAERKIPHESENKEYDVSKQRWRCEYTAYLSQLWNLRTITFQNFLLSQNFKPLLQTFDLLLHVNKICNFKRFLYLIMNNFDKSQNKQIC